MPRCPIHSSLPHSMLAAVCMVAILLVAACSGPDLNDPDVQAALTEARNLGLAYLEENRLQEAETAFEQVIDLNPEDASGHANLGIVYLRLGSYDQAETHLTRAAELAPDDPNIPLSLSALYEQTDRVEQARRIVDEALQRNPDHVQTLYTRALLYSGEASLVTDYARYLDTVVQAAPANIVPRFYLVESLIESDSLQRALTALMELRQQLPDIPREAQPHFEAAVAALQAGEVSGSFQAARVFHNLMKVTPYYQTSLRLLGLRTDAAVGVPIISEPTGLGGAALAQTDGSPDILADMQFTDASANAGLQDILQPGQALTAMVLLDIDGDNETDIFAPLWNEATRTASFALLKNQFGRFSDSASAAGFETTGNLPLYALSADFDNDTFIDLFVFTQGPDHLFHNRGDGTFVDAGASSGIDVEDLNAATFADIDHDGDLDLLVARDGPNLVYRNNLDGSFTEIAAETGLDVSGVRDIDFADIDDDGDLDLLFSGADGVALFTNARQGSFERLPQGLPGTSQTTTSAIGDYNNDGFMDILSSTSEGLRLFQNEGDNRFTDASEALPPFAGDIPSFFDALFIDIDNDGYLDLAFTGPATRILHNTRDGAFEETTATLLPAGLPPAAALSSTDYNLDRDLDLFLQTSDGVMLLRNDGGQANRLLSIQTRGLVNNNSKNNYYSIGAKVELRAGDLYQTRVVTEPVTYFGLGKRVKADVIRIVFTNGVPQNIFRPGTDQDIIEQQILKGSCPFLYTWNGSEFVFATDLLWRSALGMPLGIMAEGATAYAPAAPAEDHIMIPEGYLNAQDGAYTLKITDELWETPYIDEVKLMLVDAPDSVDIRIDESFGPPPSGSLPLHSIVKKTPVSAVRDSGEDVTTLLQAADQVFAYPPSTSRFQGLVDQYGYVLTPKAPINTDQTILYLQGWIFPTDASINVSMSQSEAYSRQAPQVQVKDAHGTWQTVIPNMGFPMGKNKTVRVDLSGRFLSSDHSVRIVTNLQLYWDHAFFAEEARSASYQTAVLAPAAADLQYRGFSRMYRTSPFAPHWFDHDSVSTAPKWIDLEGYYTRYGDVTELLQATNDQYVIMNAGDAMTISFDAGQAPALPPGWNRRFVLYTNGWLKDGDLNTAHGSTVEPLPFVGMSAYPYGAGESYPMTPSNRAYLNTYNTRRVTSDAFRDWLKR